MSALTRLGLDRREQYDVCGRHFFRANLEGSSAAPARKHDAGISPHRSGLAEEYVAAGQFFQERQIGDVPNDDNTESLHVDVCADLGDSFCVCFLCVFALRECAQLIE